MKSFARKTLKVKASLSNRESLSARPTQEDEQKFFQIQNIVLHVSVFITNVVNDSPPASHRYWASFKTTQLAVFFNIFCQSNLAA